MPLYSNQIHAMTNYQSSLIKQPTLLINNVYIYFITYQIKYASLQAKTCGNIVCILLPTTTATRLRLITPILTTELSLGDNLGDN